MKKIPGAGFPVGDPEDETAIIGDGVAGGVPVSMKTLQAIYNEITGKAEELGKRYDESFQVTFADLEQLHLKMEQCCEQYSLQSKNESIVVYHLDDTKEQFSSFERFRLYNKSSISPTESVLLKFNLLIVLPKTRQAQSYTVSVRIGSQITTMQRLRKEASSLGVLRLVITQTAVVTISYVDYMVAKNLLTVVESWFDALHTAQQSHAQKLLAKLGQYLPGIGGYPLGALTLFLSLDVISKSLRVGSSPDILASHILIAMFAVILNYRIGRFLGLRIEEALHSVQELGTISLNRGDEKQLDYAEKNNRLAMLRVGLSSAGALLVGIISSLIADWLSK